MQHLFNRIYVAPIHRVEQQEKDSAAIFLTDNPIVLDALALQVGDDTLTRLQQVRFSIEVGDLLFYATSYDAMLVERFNGNENEFFQFLMYTWPTSRKLVIYADLPQVERLLIRWFKTILPNATKESVFTLLRLISLREQLLVHNHKPSFAVPVDRVYNLDFAGTLTFTYSDALWTSTQSFAYNATDNNVLGLEFLLATYLFKKLKNEDTSRWMGTSPLTEKVMRFVKKRLVYSLLDDKDGIVQSLHHAKELFGVDLDITDPAAVQAFVATNPKYSWLFDNSFKPDNYQTVWATNNIAEVFATGNELIRKIDKEVGVYNADRHEVLKQVFKNNVTLEDVIAVETAVHFSCLILAAEVTDKSLNRYLLDYIFHLYTAQDIANLHKLSVEYDGTHY